MSGDPGRFFDDASREVDAALKATQAKGITVESLLAVTGPLANAVGDEKRKAFLRDVVVFVGDELVNPDAYRARDNRARENLGDIVKAIKGLQTALGPLREWHQGGMQVDTALKSLRYRSPGGGDEEADIDALLLRLRRDLQALSQASTYAVNSPHLMARGKSREAEWWAQRIVSIYANRFGGLPPARGWFADGGGDGVGLMSLLGEKLGFRCGKDIAAKAVKVFEEIARWEASQSDDD